MNDNRFFIVFGKNSSNVHLTIGVVRDDGGYVNLKELTKEYSQVFISNIIEVNKKDFEEFFKNS